MTLNAVTEAVRLSVAPMMDGGDLDVISESYAGPCVANVHISIA